MEIILQSQSLLTHTLTNARNENSIAPVLLAPPTSGPRDVPRCGALSLLQKDAALQGGDTAETAVG